MSSKWSEEQRQSMARDMAGFFGTFLPYDQDGVLVMWDDVEQFLKRADHDLVHASSRIVLELGDRQRREMEVPVE